MVIALSKVPVRFMLKGVKGLVFIMLLTLCFNIFLTPGVPLWQIGIFRITKEGIRSAVLLGLRLVLLVMGTSVMTLTTTPNALTDGFEKLLMPLRVTGLPVHEIALMMSIALRFIPVLMEETDKIMKAQMARGADFENGPLIRRAGNIVPILVPLFVSAFRRASDLALAMEARCYTGGDGRTKMNPLKYSRSDHIAVGVCCAYLFLVIMIRVWF